MCGIVGIFGKNVDAAILAGMCRTMVHRGPDGDGIWVSNDQKIGLAHRRLAIIDLSNSAAQPMSTRDGLLHVVYNGEIYNHLELRAELEVSGYPFFTDHSDTEVLLQGYRAWGLEGLLNRLQGMFAFALYDVQEKTLLLARDRAGVKPLYYNWTNGTFLFGSEIKAILAHPIVSREIEPAAMYHYLSFMVAPAPLTLFKGIYKLQAGHWLKVNQEGACTTKRWWHAVPGKGILTEDISKLSANAKQDFYIQGVRSRLEAAVKKRLVSDVSVGVFLSGGVDSTSILALMSQFANKPVNSFSVGFSDHPEMNELAYARSASQQFGSEHHEILISDADVPLFLEKLVHHQDEPIADWVCIPLYFVSRLARDAGIKVVQIGEGADEQFCGYPYYLQMLNWHQQFWKPLCKLPLTVRQLAAYVAMLVASMRIGLAPHADMMSRAARNGEIFWTGAPVFWEILKHKFISHRKIFRQEAENEQAMIDIGLLPKEYLELDSAHVIHSFTSIFDKGFPSEHQLTRMIHTEFQLRLPELLLMRVDKMTMANSVEARVPFLDTDLIDFSMDIPTNLKIFGKQPKQLLKTAVRGLIPDSIIDRPKQGFGAPMSHWLRGSLGSYVKSKILSSSLIQQGWFDIHFIQQLFVRHNEKKQDCAIQIWTLFNLVAWYDYWIDNKSF